MVGNIRYTSNVWFMVLFVAPAEGSRILGKQSVGDLLWCAFQFASVLSTKRIQDGYCKGAPVNDFFAFDFTPLR